MDKYSLITVGSLVGIIDPEIHERPETRTQARSLIANARSTGPFKVRGQIGPDHVSLEDMRGNPMHFGNSDYLSIHINFVELWRFT